jgi:hypothetical protein
MDNENNQIPQPGALPQPGELPQPGAQPTTELPSIQQTTEANPSKTLEEISGLKNQLNETATPPPGEEPEHKSKAELYSKITRIALPVIVAIVLIAIGTFAYNIILGGSEDTPEEIPLEEVNLGEVDEGILTPPSDELADELAEGLEYALQQGIEGGEIFEEEEETSIPGAPTITPIKITPIK